jgi:hypothetical protein
LAENNPEGPQIEGKVSGGVRDLMWEQNGREVVTLVGVVDSDGFVVPNCCEPPQGGHKAGKADNAKNAETKHIANFFFDYRAIDHKKRLQDCARTLIST